MSTENENLDFLSFEMYGRRLNLFESLPTTKGAIVFVGDSLTQRNQWSEFFPQEKILNRGIDSDRTIGILSRLNHIITLKPKKIFLMIGINDIFDGRDSIYINYESIVHRIRKVLPETTLYIQSLLPVNNSVFGHEINNEHVITLNSELEQLAKSNELTYIDLYSHVIKNNELNEQHTLDGCHLSGLGYSTWANVIRALVLE